MGITHDIILIYVIEELIQYLTRQLKEDLFVAEICFLARSVVQNYFNAFVQRIIDENRYCARDCTFSICIW
jgi:hypothetical protein